MRGSGAAGPGGASPVASQPSCAQTAGENPITNPHNRNKDKNLILFLLNMLLLLCLARRCQSFRHSWAILFLFFFTSFSWQQMEVFMLFYSLWRAWSLRNLDLQRSKPWQKHHKALTKKTRFPF
jgi:hypothetical protein